MSASPQEVSTVADVEGDDYVAWKSWRSEDFGTFTKLDDAYYRAEAGEEIGHGSRVLEIGFGNGSFLAWARARGAEVHGVESSALLLARASRLFGTAHAHDMLEAPELTTLYGTFSHVVAFDVLEHIEQRDYPKVFRQLATLLARGGKCVLRFPNGDSPFGRRIQHGDPSHVTAIGSDKIGYFAFLVGLEVEALRPPALPVVGVGLRRGMKRRLVLVLRYCLENFLGTLYYGRRVHLDENITAVLRRP
jgi:2-polyprenyl-3-methyl-5-hydroxy-6-metoxy-1,4-benzoquinol methylase